MTAKLARPLMLPLQPTDIRVVTEKRNIMATIYWLCVFLLEEGLVSKEVL